jgi:hypothetical protein
MRKRIVIGLLAVGLLVGAGLWVAQRFGRTPAALFVAGQKRVYRVELTSDSHTDFSQVVEDAGPGSSTRLKTHLDGELVVAVLSAGERGAELAVWLRRARVQIAGDAAANPELTRGVESDLGKPFFVKVGTDGRVERLWLPAGLSAISAGFARALVSSVQIIWPEGNESVWEVEQDDPAGTARVRYERSGQEMRLTRLGYQPPTDNEEPDEIRLTPTVEPEGSLVVTIDPRTRRLLGVEGREITTLSIEGRPAGRSETKIAVSLSEEEKLDGKERARLEREQSALIAATLSVPLVNPAPGEEARHRNTLGKRTADELLAELPRVRPEGETPLYLQFRALLWLEPGQAKKIGAPLKTAKADTPTLRILTQALALCGRGEAQTVLVELVRTRKDEWPIMAEVLSALGTTRQPTEEVDRVLLEIARTGRDWNTRSTAQLALGSLGRTLARQSPTRASAILSWAVDELTSARTAALKRQFLLVLGNTASSEALPAIRPYLTDSDPGVRGAAVVALRWHTDGEIEVVLCKALLEDKDQTVRQEAANAFEVRPPTPKAVEALCQALKRDQSVSVRLAALARLIAVRKKYKEADSAIREASKNDPAKEVREAAGE